MRPMFSVYEVVPTEPSRPESAQHMPSAPMPRFICGTVGSLMPAA